MVNKAEKILKAANLDGTFWGGRMIDGWERGRMTGDDVDNSHSWNMCACGELVPELLTKDLNAGLVPSDPILLGLGDDFNFLCRSAYLFSSIIENRKNIEDMAHLQIAIESRVTKLLNERGYEYA